MRLDAQVSVQPAVSDAFVVVSTRSENKPEVPSLSDEVTSLDHVGEKVAAKFKQYATDHLVSSRLLPR